jgi:hypothetical protein
MEEIFKIVLTSAFTIIGAVLIFSITKILELVYIKPFFDFKDKLSKTNTNLNFYRNILTNSVNREEINDGLVKEIMKAQETVRADWASLKSVHAVTPKLFKNRNKVFLLRK